MHGLPADTERAGNGLPAPALLTRVRDVDGLQSLLQLLQRAHGGQSDSGVSTGQRFHVSHAVKFN
jgi:hypothetical protein